MFRDFVASNRLAVSRVFGLVFVLFVAFVSPPWHYDSGIALLSESAGYLLLVIATGGRIWTSLYIAGVKNQELASEGPYSIVRNPLYVFSFIGAIGFGLAVENPVAGGVLVLFFLLYYPAVVRREERCLAERFGDQFATYCRRTPRWLPRLRNYRQPERHTVHVRRFTRYIASSLWFVLAYLLWEVIEGLQRLGVVPVLW